MPSSSQWFFCLLWVKNVSRLDLLLHPPFGKKKHTFWPIHSPHCLTVLHGDLYLLQAYHLPLQSVDRPTIFWLRLNSPTIMGFDGFWVGFGWVLSLKILKHPEISINIIYLKCHLLSSTLENTKKALAPK